MKKNLLLYGVFLCALSMSSCSGGSKSSHVMDSSSMSVENANEVMKYYDTSLKILKDLEDLADSLGKVISTVY